MADVITRFKLETTQYDSALRDASKALSNYSKQAELAGKDFGKYTQSQVEAARALGNIATSATNTKDKVKELVSAYNDVAKAYNKLTEEQKKSDFGKAMAESLNTLQGRIRDAKAEMNATPGILDKLASKFTVNIDALKLFSVGLQAAQGALGVAKDAFFASEATVDEWGRVTASAQSVYEGFLTAINNGDLSGYLNNINEIVQAARKAYNELDRLGTMKTIQSPQTERQNAENTRMRTMLMTGRYIAPAAGTGLKASMADGTLLTPAQLKKIEGQLQNGMNTIVKLTGNELAQTGKAIDAYYDKLAKQNGMTMAEFRKGTSSMAEFDRRMAGAKAYSDYQRQNTITDERTGIQRYIGGANPYEQFKKWATFRVDKQGANSYNELVGLIRQQQQQTSQMYSTIGQAYRTINRAEGVTVKGIMNGGRGGSGGGSNTDKTEAFREKVGYGWDKAFVKMQDMVPELPKEVEAPKGLAQIADMAEDALSPLQEMNMQLKGMIDMLDTAPDETAYQNMLQNIEDKQKEIAKFKGENVGADKMAKSWKTAQQAIAGVGSALSALNNPAIDIMTVIGQSIATIALAYSETLAKDSSSKSNIWSFIAAAAAATVSMATTIASLHSSTGYAEGGIVKGNSYSGDNMMFGGDGLYGLNAGEVVLTRAMQGNLASQLQSTGMAGMQMTARVKGTDLLLSIDRAIAVSGRGQLVTFK